MPLVLAAPVIAAALFFMTRSIEASLAALALVVAFAVFLWLMWAIFPALGETVREYLKKRFG